MSASKPPRATALLIVGLLAAACEQRPEFRYETEHLRIATNFDEPLCRGDLDHYESVITRLELVLDTTVHERTDVYLRDFTEPRPLDWCSDEHVEGCYNDGEIHAHQATIDHELVHAVVASIGSPKDFWNEGAATSLQTDRIYFYGAKPSDTLEGDAPGLSYSAAGTFSRWLFETYGVQRYRALLRAPGTAREAFEQIYEMTIEEAEEQYFAQVPYSYGAFMDCDAPELAQVAELQWSEDIAVDCDKPHVHGGPLGLTASRVLTITERANYTFSTTAELGVIAACYGARLDSKPVLGDPALGDVPPNINTYFGVRAIPGGELTTFDLVPGRYDVRFNYSDSFEPRTARVDVQGAPP